MRSGADLGRSNARRAGVAVLAGMLLWCGAASAFAHSPRTPHSWPRSRPWPRVEQIRIPDGLSLGDPVTISIAAAGPRGVSAVVVQLGDDLQHVPADGSRRVVVVVRLVPTEAGRLPLLVTPLARDGVPGRTRATLLSVADHTSDVPIESRDELVRRVREWEASGADPYRLYSRGPLYQRGPSDAIQRSRARIFRVVDGLLDRLRLQLGIEFLPFNWWRLWLAGGNRQPFDWASHCGPEVAGPTPGGELLECWLDLHPLIRAALVWQEVDPGTGQVTLLAYDDWPSFQKNSLNVSFFHYWTWMEAGAGEDFPGIELVSPPFNQVQPQGDDYPVTAFSGYDARSLYIQSVAHSLAVEIGGFLPWSILQYGSYSDLLRLLSSEYFFEAGEYLGDTPFIGWWPSGNVTHAPPTLTFRFLVEENILRPTHYDTIARMMLWGRENLGHYSGGASVANMLAQWGYAGDPPVARILTKLPGETLAWIQGCHGMSFFLQSLLRAVNIPVAPKTLHQVPGVGVHRSPIFYTVGQTLSHGDDVFNIRWVVPSVDPDFVPPEEVFISLATFAQWFPGTVEGQTANVGRRVAEVTLDVLPDKLMDLYCDDLTAQVPPASGSVLAHFSPRFYTYQELAGMNLWGRLLVKELTYDFCDAPVVFSLGPFLPQP
jgi:hypothetical protein